MVALGIHADAAFHKGVNNEGALFAGAGRCAIGGDKEGSGTITFMMEDSGGATVDVVTQTITVVK